MSTDSSERSSKISERSPTVERISHADLIALPAFEGMLSRYARECGLPELGPANPQHDIYGALELAGAMRFIVARLGPKAIGFCVLTVSRVPHFGAVVAHTESLFIEQAQRHTGAGLLLMREAERLALEMGAMGLFIAAPVNSKLDRVLRCTDYRPTTVAHFKVLKK